MFKAAALAFASLMIAAGTPHVIAHAPHPRLIARQTARPTALVRPAPLAAEGPGETLSVYYSPLDSTKVSRFVGFGTAYHMAIVYTDAAGRSYGASSGPSDLDAGQTPAHALSALVAAAGGTPSSFGSLVADPHNNTPFQKGGSGDFYTRDAQGHAYPLAIVARDRDLSARWAAILRTYEKIGGMHLPYSPISQNSNSVAVTALRRAGVSLQFSSATPFAPGSFTRLPDA